LNDAGYWVAAAHTGGDACQTYDELKPDIVVTDLGLPGRSDGVQVIQHVAERSGGKVPVILVTGHERATVPHAAASHVTSILVKPVLPDRLESEVRLTLARAREARERAQEIQRRIGPLVQKSMTLGERSLELRKRVSPPQDPGTCPDCGGALRAASEVSAGVPQYEYFEPCRSGCGRFFRDRKTSRYYRLP
jgi:DNA-binding response OmpR family regulator